MKWTDTVASRCRYGSVAARIFGDAEVIAERSEDDYQGHANVVAKMKDGTFVHYEWSYGSCSGCDEWEAAGLTRDAIEAEMRRALAVLPDVATAQRYFHLDGEYSGATVPTANSALNGGLPQMLRAIYSDDVTTEFAQLGAEFQAWLDRQSPPAAHARPSN